jgi:hypothetical protein
MKLCNFLVTCADKKFMCYLRVRHDHTKCAEGIIQELLINILLQSEYGTINCCSMHKMCNKTA